MDAKNRSLLYADYCRSCQTWQHQRRLPVLQTLQAPHPGQAARIRAPLAVPHDSTVQAQRKCQLWHGHAGCRGRPMHSCIAGAPGTWAWDSPDLQEDRPGRGGPQRIVLSPPRMRAHLHALPSRIGPLQGQCAHESMCGWLAARGTQPASSLLAAPAQCFACSEGLSARSLYIHSGIDRLRQKQCNESAADEPFIWQPEWGFARRCRRSSCREHLNS